MRTADLIGLDEGLSACTLYGLSHSNLIIATCSRQYPARAKRRLCICVAWHVGAGLEWSLCKRRPVAPPVRHDRCSRMLIDCYALKLDGGDLEPFFLELAIYDAEATPARYSTSDTTTRMLELIILSLLQTDQGQAVRKLFLPPQFGLGLGADSQSRDTD